MIKNIRDRFAELFKTRSGPPIITETSSLHEISLHYPNIFEFVERKYGIKVEPGERTRSLKEFTERYALPPSQIVFMEVQMSVRTRGVQTVEPKEAKRLLDKTLRPELLDVRETWEMQLCGLPHARALTPQLLDEILGDWEKDKPMILFCHFGIRSLDAATFLADRGFTHVAIIRGGIDAWSLEIDQKITRYENAWC